LCSLRSLPLLKCVNILRRHIDFQRRTIILRPTSFPCGREGHRQRKYLDGEVSWSLDWGTLSATKYKCAISHKRFLNRFAFLLSSHLVIFLFMLHVQTFFMCRVSWVRDNSSIASINPTLHADDKKANHDDMFASYREILMDANCLFEWNHKNGRSLSWIILESLMSVVIRKYKYFVTTMAATAMVS
jgi:hypothetical protein